ncbi:alpha/beta family hydrolase [Polycladidibacter hongkongensis]|uniref:alpha/beta family hydrolase n=1 Tax=Polycladidibacter hongkongensis TaxID=1647556 RepID=UPI0008374F02|nr:alpha/beta family hydrolase [Pseudovibrio hongkongensis]
MIEILWNKPEQAAIGTMMLAHGAGAGQDSSFMERFTNAAVACGFAVARFEFSYMAKRRTSGKKAPPPKAEKLIGEYQNALQQILGENDLPIFLAGKSMGGRVAAMLAGGNSLPKRVRGVVCLGYPFHPVGKTELEHWRLAPLQASNRPLLILQGERDQFGKREELDGFELPEQAELHYIDDGNHDFAPRGAAAATWDGNIKRAAALARAFAEQH